MRNSKRRFIALGVFLALCLGIGFLEGVWTQTSVSSWYPTLKKASFTPPPWVFGPVWTFLYLLIALAGWTIFCMPSSLMRKKALWIYGVQLFLNWIWSYLFFGLKSPILAFIDITALTVVVVGMTLYFWKLKPLASILLWPYVLWMLYAWLLNGSIVILNRG